MDLSDIQERDLSESTIQIIPADTYTVFVDELKEGASKNGKHMFTVDFVIAEGAYKGQKLKHWFMVESKAGKAVFKYFLRCISKDDKAPNQFGDAMKQHCLGRMLRVGVGLEPSGRYLNSRVICMGHETEDPAKFQDRFEKALVRFDDKIVAESKTESKLSYAASQSGDVPF